MTDATTCPECHEPLIVRTSKRLTPQTIQQRRVCKCCTYSVLATLRSPLPTPPTLVSVRVVRPSCNTTTDSPQT